LSKGQTFPNPATRFIDLATDDLQWTYRGSPNGETGMPGILDISF
jgi:hypothetical protein